MARQRCKDLAAIDNPAAIGPQRRGAERRLAGRRIAALGKGLGIDRAILEDAVVMAGPHGGVFLALRCAHIDAIGQNTRPQAGTDMHVEGQRGGTAIAADFSRRQHIGAQIGAAPTMLGGNADAKKVLRLQIGVILGREARLAVDLGGAWREFRLRQLARLGAERRFKIGQVPAVRIENRLRRQAVHQTVMCCHHACCFRSRLLISHCPAKILVACRKRR